MVEHRLRYRNLGKISWQFFTKPWHSFIADESEEKHLKLDDQVEFPFLYWLKENGKAAVGSSYLAIIFFGLILAIFVLIFGGGSIWLAALGAAFIFIFFWIIASMISWMASLYIETLSLLLNVENYLKDASQNLNHLTESKKNM